MSRRSIGPPRRRRRTARAPRAPARSHPLVVTLDKKSAPRAVFSGDRWSRSTCPRARACIYPRPPLEPLKDVDAAIRYALNHPLGSDPLHAKLRPGMKVVIAIDDISLPLPPMRRPDVRERVLTVVLEMLADHGVEDVEMIIATSHPPPHDRPPRCGTSSATASSTPTGPTASTTTTPKTRRG